MKKQMILMVVMVAALLSAGCVDIEQEIHMNHDGSGKIIETVSLTARGMRLFEGLKKRSGTGGAAPAMLSEEAFQTRMKAMGEVSLVSKEDVLLPDGRRQIKSVYSFRDSNKVKLWIVPTLAYMKMERGNSPDGGIGLQYISEYDTKWGKIYKETVNVVGANTQFLPKPVPSTPVERQKYLRVLPIFLDMLKDFHLSIVLVAPIEDFEENDMKWNLPIEKNRVTVFKMDGNSVVRSPEMIQQLVMNEVVASSIGSLQDSMSGVFTPWPAIHGGRGVRFMKSTPAPVGSAPGK
jgi:hypothetical protein